MKHIDSSFDFRGPFQLPGTTLFRDFCASCIKRYALDGIVRKARVGALADLSCACWHAAPQMRDGTTTPGVCWLHVADRGSITWSCRRCGFCCIRWTCCIVWHGPG
jgi:hypothetical protein